jgi:hypothetical protein
LCFEPIAYINLWKVGLLHELSSHDELGAPRGSEGDRLARSGFSVLALSAAAHLEGLKAGKVVVTTNSVPKVMEEKTYLSPGGFGRKVASGLGVGLDSFSLCS